MSEVLAPRPPTASPEPTSEPQPRLPWLRLILVMVLIGGVLWLFFYGARIRDARATYTLEVGQWLESVEDGFTAVPLLTPEEEALLRRSLNARHVALARELGIPPVTMRDSLVAEAEAQGLVPVDRPTPYYTAGAARYSVPYVTPSAAASLDSIGARFHARLDAAGLPRYRFVVTSILRSTEDQAALQGRNVNAARSHSSHEYGTTYDLHYRRFAYGEPGLLTLPEPPGRLPRFVERSLRVYAEAETEAAFARFAEAYPSRLGALLGRVLIALEDEGVVVTVMERLQPVYHTTVARELVETETGAADAR